MGKRREIIPRFVGERTGYRFKRISFSLLLMKKQEYLHENATVLHEADHSWYVDVILLRFFRGFEPSASSNQRRRQQYS